MRTHLPSLIIHSVFSATLLKVVYGIDIDDGDHGIVRDIRDAVQGVSEGFVPGKFLVDYIPWLKYVPAWFPGAEFQRKCAMWRAKQVVVKDVPFELRNTSLVSAGAFVADTRSLSAHSRASARATMLSRRVRPLSTNCWPELRRGAKWTMLRTGTTWSGLSRVLSIKVRRSFVTPFLHATHDLHSRCRYGMVVPIYTTLYLLIDVRCSQSQQCKPRSSQCRCTPRCKGRRKLSSIG